MRVSARAHRLGASLRLKSPRRLALLLLLLPQFQSLCLRALVRPTAAAAASSSTFVVGVSVRMTLLLLLLLLCQIRARRLRTGERAGDDRRGWRHGHGHHVVACIRDEACLRLTTRMPRWWWWWRVW